jgi:tetratricopeptide (TPR) repeat protein
MQSSLPSIYSPSSSYAKAFLAIVNRPGIFSSTDIGGGTAGSEPQRRPDEGGLSFKVFTLDRDDVLQTLHDHSSSASSSETTAGKEAMGPFHNEATDDEVMFDDLDADNAFSPMSVDDRYQPHVHAFGDKAPASSAKSGHVSYVNGDSDQCSYRYDEDVGAFNKMFADISLTENIQFNIGKPGQASSSSSSSSLQASRKTPSKKPSSRKKSAPHASTRVGNDDVNADALHEQMAGDEPPLWWKHATKVGNSEEAVRSNQGSRVFTDSVFRDAAVGDSGAEEEEFEDIAIPEQTAPASKGPPNKGVGGELNDRSMVHLANMYSKQGKDLYSSGCYEKALDAYDRCMKIAPPGWFERATALGNRAAVLVMLHRFVEAVNDCDEALRLDSNMVKLLVRKGRALLRLGHFNPAEESLSRVLEFNVRDLLTPREALDDDLLQATFDSLENNKSNAKLGLKDLQKLRELTSFLMASEGQMKHREVLKAADDLLKLSPCYRIAHLSKAAAMCELLQFDEAKQFVEELTRRTDPTTQRLYAHPSARIPCPRLVDLQWTECKADRSLAADLPAIAQFVLCAGSELGRIYLRMLKNVSFNRSYSADVMHKVAALLRALEVALSTEDKAESWSWVSAELDKVQCLLSLKTTADEQFKGRQFKAALMKYTNCLKVSVLIASRQAVVACLLLRTSSVCGIRVDQLDPSALRWNAIICSNRAAANMSLGMHSDAISDCNQAIQKDPDFSKAYLRRARAYRVSTIGLQSRACVDK